MATGGTISDFRPRRLAACVVRCLHHELGFLAGIVKLRLTAVFDAKHGGPATS